MSIKNTLKLIGVAILPLFLFSCSASWHLQRAYDKDPSLFNNDTTVITVPDIQIDTVFNNSIDTIKVEKDLQAILDSLGLEEICKDVVEPITKYITTVKFIDTTIVLVDTFKTDSFQVVIETNLIPTDSGAYVLETHLKDIQYDKITETIYVRDTSYLSKFWEIVAGLFVLFLLLVILRLLFR